MKPEESAGCHQTLSHRWGLGTRLRLLVTFGNFFRSDYVHLWRWALVSSPDPNLSQGETVWWTKLNFLSQHTLLQQCNLANFKTFMANHLKNVQILGLLSGKWLPISQSHWSLPLFGNKLKKFNLFTRQFLAEKHTLTGHETNGFKEDNFGSRISE